MSRPAPARRRGPSHDRWLIPYADLVTLLFAFVTALYAATSADASRLGHIAEGVRAAVGSAPAPAPPPPLAAPSPVTTAAADAAVPETPTPPEPPDLEARAAIERGLADELASARLELIEDRRGLVLAIPEAGAFDTGRADLTAVALPLMERIAAVLAGLPNAIRVEGHTDDTPIRTPRFDSNWELSTARATTVVAFFIERAGIAPDRLSAAGYSQFKPRAANDSPEGRARNRRVDIVVLNVATAAAEEPLAGDPRPCASCT